MKKKQKNLLIGFIISIIVLSTVVPLLISYFNIFGVFYDFFAFLAGSGIFFIIYLIGSFLFVPLLYSTLIKEKLSFNVEKSKKKPKNPRYYASILFLVGLPIMIWLILGNLGYYSCTAVSGGFGDFVLNGFLVILIMDLYFCVFPAIVLALKKNRY